ncbi:MAG: hypothetical protein JSW53_02355, partial [Candidatus Bathyarchaeota archaeon]
GDAGLPYELLKFDYVLFQIIVNSSIDSLQLAQVKSPNDNNAEFSIKAFLRKLIEDILGHLAYPQGRLNAVLKSSMSLLGEAPLEARGG